MSAEATAEADYWLAVPDRAPALPVDEPSGANREGLAQTVRVELTAEETRNLLQEVPKAYRTQINDVLLAALVQTAGGGPGIGRCW